MLHKIEIGIRKTLRWSGIIYHLSVWILILCLVFLFSKKTSSIDFSSSKVKILELQINNINNENTNLKKLLLQREDGIIEGHGEIFLDKPLAP